ncbi:glycosyltransferase [Alkalicoccus luteus]|uniref:Glycosyltransferase n=1 Tax=Alkalicoccus luteus TaxID=1237094 RepID=A0A969PQZ1_9BACI|nr:glycosyltransferase [Alkalicoccus luteus]NJP38772.1 glycosyltransferase [Alkalicoccus luteus]
MSKKLLIISFDLEIGGVEKSLISLLEELSKSSYDVHLFLMSHTGELMDEIPDNIKLLPEIPAYATFRKSIKDTFASRFYRIGWERLLAKVKANAAGKQLNLEEPGYRQMQWMWERTIERLPQIPGTYDMVISFLWPHYAALNAEAPKKAAWIHTDFSKAEVDRELDRSVWETFDTIAAVSGTVRQAFLSVYPEFSHKTVVVENVLPTERIIREAQACEKVTSDNKHILTIARLSHAKGIDTAIYTAAELKKRNRFSFLWQVIGYGGEEPALKKLMEELNVQDCFQLLGKKRNPYTYLKSADLYVQPSRYEGKAVTVSEAQLFGIPVVIAGYPTAAAQVKHLENGIISGQTSADLADSIEDVMLHKEVAARLRAGCAKLDFSAESQMAQFHELIRGGP